MHERVSDLIVEAVKCHRETESRFIDLWNRANKVLSGERGIDRLESGEPSSGLWVRFVTSLDAGGFDWRIQAIFGGSKLKDYKEGKHMPIIYLAWRKFEYGEGWNDLATLRIEREGDNGHFVVVASQINGKRFDSATVKVDEDFTKDLDLIDRVLTEVFQA